jgi:hypothetical protein
MNFNMATLHREFVLFNKEIKLTTNRKESLKTSRKTIKKRIKKWFSENKPNELQPKFWGQGSFEMNTTINPILTTNEDGEKILKYDLDYGVYFIEKVGEDNQRAIQTWHNWIFDAVDDHTNMDSIDKNTCVRVVFADYHHIDLPIYYKNGEIPQLAHRIKSWIDSDPKAFYEWFNSNKTLQLERIVRALKAWKNYRETNNTNLKLPSGFELTILAKNNYHEDEFDDVAFRETIRNIDVELNKPNGFKCLRPTTPIDEDVFSGYSETRKNNFLSALKSLLNDCDRAKNENNFKKASEYLRDNQFGNRFPKGDDMDDVKKSEDLKRSIGKFDISPKPYGY